MVEQTKVLAVKDWCHEIDPWNPHKGEHREPDSTELFFGFHVCVDRHMCTPIIHIINNNNTTNKSQILFNRFACLVSHLNVLTD